MAEDSRAVNLKQAVETEPLNEPTKNKTLSLKMFMMDRLFEEPKRILEPNIMETKIEIEGGIHWYGWQWDRKSLLKTLWIFFMFLVVASLIKVGYHHSQYLITTIPESCILIIIGLVFGALIQLIAAHEEMPEFTVDLFFFALLPPIILESAYSLHDHSFFNNLVTILMYAIFGTLINVFLIGLSLYAVEKIAPKIGMDFPAVPLIELMTFATAISAVDPVCVLAIFHDLSVNKSLYYLVFGESLFNDAVVIVLHRLMSAFIKAELVTAKDIVNGLVSFFSVSVGGFIIGVLFGVGTAIITLSTKKVRVVEPMIMIAMVYLSFLTSELLEWSGLISMIACGLVQAEYAFTNISLKSYTTVKYFTKTLSSLSDLLIFFFLGQTLITHTPYWHTTFVVFSIIFCILYRIVSVFSLSYISNNYFLRNRIINFEEQTLMAYGGLRGAVAFALIAILEEEHGITFLPLFRTTTLAIILFTVFFLGGTTKPLLKLLRIQREHNTKHNLFLFVNDKLIEAIILGIEGISGNRSVVYYMKQWFRDLNDKYVRNMLTHGRPFDGIESAWRKSQFDTVVHQIYGKPNVKPVEQSDKILSREDVLNDLQNMSDKIRANREAYRLDTNKDTKNQIVIEDVNRIKTVPKDFGSKIVETIEKSKRQRRKSPQSDRSPKDYLMSRFKLTRKTVDDRKPKEIKPIAEKMRAPPRTVAVKKSTEDLDYEHDNMSQTLKDAFSKSHFYHVPQRKMVTDSKQIAETQLRRRQFKNEQQNSAPTKPHKPPKPPPKPPADQKAAKKPSKKN